MADQSLLNSYLNNNYDKSGTDNLTKFFGFNQNIYVDPAVTGYAFIFITKPSLFIYPQKPADNETNKMLAYNNMCIDPKFSMYITGENANKKDQALIKQLSYFKFSDNNSLFMPIFTNMARSINTLDVNLETTQAYQTREGFNMTIPINTTPSITSGSVSIGVSDTDNFDFTKMISIWVEYINNITNGTFTANPEMIKQNILDYTCSIYYFLLSPDGRTIKYWSRYTSCYPTTIPYGNLSYQKGSIDANQLEINFQYALKEDMNPKILEDFNTISLQLVSPELFSDINYDNFIANSAVDTENGYVSYINNPLLNKKALYNGLRRSTVTNDNRDPLVFYENESQSSVMPENYSARYVLSFGKNSIINDYANKMLGANDVFNYTSLQDSEN